MRFVFQIIGFSLALLCDVGQSAPKTLYTSLIVIWEGPTIEAFNVVALEELRKTLPGLPMIHFIDPVILQRDNNSSQLARIKQGFRPGDTYGIHLSGWRASVEGAGVTFKNKPSFWAEYGDPGFSEDGRDVPLSTYNDDELQKIISTGVKNLKTHLAVDVTAFHASGWMSSSALHHIAAKEGLKYSFNAVEPAILERDLGRFATMNDIRANWRDVMRPFKPQRSHGIWEYGTVGIIADYFDVTLTKKFAEDSLSSDGAFAPVVFHGNTLIHRRHFVETATKEFIQSFVKAGTILAPLYLTEQIAH